MLRFFAALRRSIRAARRRFTGARVVRALFLAAAAAAAFRRLLTGIVAAAIVRVTLGRAGSFVRAGL